MIIAVLWCLSARFAEAGADLVSFESGSCELYRYDLAEGDVSEVELSQILELVGPIYTLRTRWVAQLELCIDGDPSYRSCGSHRPSSPKRLAISPQQTSSWPRTA